MSRTLRVATVALAMQACAPLSTQQPRAAHSTLGCIRAAVAQHALTTLPDQEAHCIAAGMIALHCSLGEAQLASYGKEFKDLFGRGDAEWRDLEADRKGIACARSATGDEPTFIACCRKTRQEQ